MIFSAYSVTIAELQKFYWEIFDPQMKEFDQYMSIAIEEAKLSLQEGNHGFGAVVIRNDEIISQSHDREATYHDPTFHAELDAIRLASKKLGGQLSTCTIISTHEPCPMCASAIVWSGISQVVFGYGIEDSVKEGRRRINIKCKEIFDRSGREINIIEGVLKDKCSILYNGKVRKSVKQLRNIDSGKLEKLSRELAQKRKDWFDEHGSDVINKNKTVLENAYELFLTKLDMSENEAPIVEKTHSKIVIHSKNFCPTLEACKILNLETRSVCKKLNEEATDLLLKKLNPNLKFGRNYNKIRPHADYCEEYIELVNSTSKAGTFNKAEGRE